MSFSLVPYLIYLKRGKGRVKFYDTLYGINFLKEMKLAIQTNLNMMVFEKYKKVLNVRKEQLFLETEKDILYGLIEAGDYGYKTNIYSLKGELKYTKSTNEVEMFPYYFLIYAPKTEDTGILLLQRFKQYGISTPIKSFLKKVVRALYRGISLGIKPMVSISMLSDYLQGEVKRLRITKVGVYPTDSASQFLEVVPEDIVQEIVIKAPTNKSLVILEDLRDPNSEQVLEFLKMFTDVKIETEVNGVIRTISLASLARFKNWYKLEDIDISEDGFPTFESIHVKALDILEQLKQEL